MNDTQDAIQHRANSFRDFCERRLDEIQVGSLSQNEALEFSSRHVADAFVVTLAFSMS